MRKRSPIAKMSVKEGNQMDKDVRDSSFKSTGMGTRYVAFTRMEWKVDNKYGEDISPVRFASAQAPLMSLLNMMIVSGAN